MLPSNNYAANVPENERRQQKERRKGDTLTCSKPQTKDERVQQILDKIEFKLNYIDSVLADVDKSVDNDIETFKTKQKSILSLFRRSNPTSENSESSHRDMLIKLKKESLEKAKQELILLKNNICSTIECT